MNIQTIAISKLNPAEYNPRTITKDEFEGLKQSLTTFGQQENLIVNKDMTIISGHQRYQAMQALGWEEAVCNLVDLDKHQEKKLNVIMNSTAISGKYDDLRLAEILEELKLDEDYEALRLNALEPLDLSPTEVEEDEVPEVLTEPPVSQLGEIYQLGRHRVMCGDSTDKASVELLMDGVKADMVFTDPPYGMDLDADYSQLTSKNSFASGKKHTNVIGDDKPFDAGFLVDMSKEVILFGADYYVDTLPNYGKDGSWMVWDKRSSESQDKGFGSNFETVWSKVRHKRWILRHEWFAFFTGGEKREYEHPTTKPVKLLADILTKVNAGTNILDLFLGSGSTIIACEQTDRTCYGMEIDPKYVDVIRKRYWKFVNGNEKGWEDGTTNSND